MARADDVPPVTVVPRERTRELDLALVRAAVLRDERAVAAWERWSEGAGPDDVWFGEQRALAAAYRPLLALGVEHPLLEIAGGIYRRTWYLNQLATRLCGEVVTCLRGEGIEVLALKGFALAHLHFRDLGARPMVDLDLLVGPDRLEDAARALEPLGLRSVRDRIRPVGLLAKDWELKDAEDNLVDLHAFSLVESTDDADLWEHPVRFEAGGVETLAPSAPDLLLNVIAHGLRWNPGHPLSWAIDAAAVLRSASSPASLDWERFCERAEARRLTPAAAAALRTLSTDFELEVPPEVQRRLSSVTTTRAQRAAARATWRAPSRAGTALMGWDRYTRFRDLAPPARRPRSFRGWLADCWDVGGTAEVLREAARRTLSPR